MYEKNAWAKYGKDTKNVLNFAEEYRLFLSKCKTERLVYTETIKLLKENGFKDLNEVQELHAGDKVFAGNKNKSIAAFVMGQNALETGLRILGAHIDSPRLDLKQNPLYENQGLAFLDTHYYGGIKKYQWVTIPLSLIGVVIKKDGTTIDVNIGENPNDPVVGINDLLIHLSAEQQSKTLGKAIEGENLDLTVGSIALDSEEKDTIKKNVANILKEKYNIEEEDFVSAEIEVVPSGQARHFGLDNSMIAGYGHDDRCCAYTSLRALLEIDNPLFTSCMILTDKEEIGSVGATGAQSLFFENTVAKLFYILKNNEVMFKTRICLENSKMLSSDVSAALDPLYASASDPRNSAYFGKGLCINKYTGSRGKSGSNDANPEYLGFIRKIFDENNINWQSDELGKVDQGGGGTIAYILGNYNMNVIDAGIPVLNMHSPMEVISKADLFEAYKGYICFLNN